MAAQSGSHDDRVSKQKLDDIGQLLPNLPSAMRDRIAMASTFRTVRKGDVVFAEGENPIWVGHVIEGALGMVKSLADGRTHITGLLLPPDIFGRMFDGPLPHAIKALSDTRMLCIQRQAFENMLIELPEVERAFVVAMQDELDLTREWIVVLSGKRIAERVAAFLAMLLRRQIALPSAAPRLQTMVRLPLSRIDLALCLGLRPESLSRAIHALARDGIIRIVTPDVFEVPDARKLVEASGHDFQNFAGAVGLSLAR